MLPPVFCFRKKTEKCHKTAQSNEKCGPRFVCERIIGPELCSKRSALIRLYNIGHNCNESNKWDFLCFDYAVKQHDPLAFYNALWYFLGNYGESKAKEV